jgi:ferredoxin-NADP reductase
MKAAPLAVVVRAVRELGPEIREFTLAPADGGSFPTYSAGSHVVVSLPIGERVHRNAYSLLGDPAERDEWRIAVRRQSGSRGGSQWLHAHAKPGLALEISWPVNLFSLVRTARHQILVAGGIGITPILGQARELARLGASFEAHYAYRGAANAAFAEELQALAPSRVYLRDSERDGHLDFGALLARRPLGTHVYVCGPQSMVDAAKIAAARLGWPPGHIHSEQFLAPAGGEPFEVEMRASGKRFTVPRDLSLLEAIEAQGIDTPSLCRGGACGQCELEVLEADGALHHHDVYLSDAERASGRKIMPCVSRLEGRCLVLNH